MAHDPPQQGGPTAGMALTGPGGRGKAPLVAAAIVALAGS
jgi:hypothetical protein